MKVSGSITGIMSTGVLIFLIFTLLQCQRPAAHTVITKWQHGSNGAVSITYDDGSINQFRKAVPIMNRLNMPGTFFINTGSIPGSKYKGRFIGRPVETIIKEARTIPTGKDNFFERASAARYLGYRGTPEYFTRAGAQMDADKPEEAYRIIDDLYRRVNNGEFLRTGRDNRQSNNENLLTWDMIKTYASQGHEFASHMVTHPYMAALDEINLKYELEKSREEILDKLGPKYTFSAECPYGTENERAMEYAYKVYPALRNRMPESFLRELNRGSRKSSVSPDMEYVQWQRGATTKTPLPMMKEWIDTTAAQNNIWLVIVIHGVDGIGWEALTSESIDEYFQYIRSKGEKLWVATFGDAVKYMRERMNAQVTTTRNNGMVTVTLNHSLDKTMYDLPLTLKTFVKRKWKEVTVKQGDNIIRVNPVTEGKDSYVIYQALPNSDAIEISGV